MGIETLDEAALVASLICMNTRKSAEAACTRFGYDPPTMLRDKRLVKELTIGRRTPDRLPGGLLLGQYDIEANALEDPTELVRRLVKAAWDRQGTEGASLFDLGQMMPEDDDPDCLFRHRWLSRGECGALVATSGVGKSIVTMQMALAWSLGLPCLGVTPIRPLKILVFETEDQRAKLIDYRDGLRRGFLAVAGWSEKQFDDAARRAKFIWLGLKTGDAFIEQMREVLLKNEYDLVIINPFFAFLGADINKSVDVTHFLRDGLDKLITQERTRCAVLLVHHTGKPKVDTFEVNGDFLMYMGAGSSELTNFIRTALAITPYKGGKHVGVYELHAAKGGGSLGWETADGRPVRKKPVCYGSILPHVIGTPEARGMLYWAEPSDDELAEITADQGKPSAIDGPKPPCTRVVADLIAANWTPANRPKADSQREWVARLPADKTCGYSRKQRLDAYDTILDKPGDFALVLFSPVGSRQKYLVLDGLHPQSELTPTETPTEEF